VASIISSVAPGTAQTGWAGCWRCFDGTCAVSSGSTAFFEPNRSGRRQIPPVRRLRPQGISSRKLWPGWRWRVAGPTRRPGASAALGRAPRRCDDSTQGILATEGGVSIPYAGRTPRDTVTFSGRSSTTPAGFRSRTSCAWGIDTSVAHHGRGSVATAGGSGGSDGMYGKRRRSVYREVCLISDRMGEKLATGSWWSLSKAVHRIFADWDRPSFLNARPGCRMPRDAAIAIHDRDPPRISAMLWDGAAQLRIRNMRIVGGLGNFSPRGPRHRRSIRGNTSNG